MDVIEGSVDAGEVRAEIERIVAALQARRASIAWSMVEAIHAEIPPYDRRADAHVDADVLAHCGAHAELILEVSREAREPTRTELAFAREAAIRRVHQGIPLDALLQAFRVGHRTVWDAILDEARDSSAGREAAVALTRPAMQYIDIASTQVAETYIGERQRIEATADRERRDLLESLLAGAPEVLAGGPPPAAPALDPAGALVVAVARGAPEQAAEQSGLERAVDGLERCARPRPLVVPRHGELVTLVTGIEPAEVAIRMRTVCAELDDGEGDGSLRVGISGLARGFAGVAQAYAEAHQALRHASPGRPAVALPEVSPYDYLAASADAATKRAIADKGRALLEADAREDGAIVKTLLAYVEEDLNVARSAERLVVHPNTVRYRLRRIAETSGYDPRTFAGLVELVTVIRAAGAGAR